jgi:hypothetical protein
MFFSSFETSTPDTPSHPENISCGHASGEIYFHSMTVTIQGLDRGNIFCVMLVLKIYLGQSADNTLTFSPVASMKFARLSKLVFFSPFF